MLIASDSNILEEEYNVDDPTETVAIPTIIIAKDFGDIIREYTKLKQDKNEHIVKRIYCNFNEIFRSKRRWNS